MVKVYAPNRRYSGMTAGVQFADGVAEVSDEQVGALAYLRRAGYGIGKQPENVSSTNEPLEPAAPALVAQPRSNDAAVMKDAGGPVSDAFLPPTNAGSEEPHGPLVVAPGLHAVPPAPIRPGDVPDEAARQEAVETELASAVLVEGQPATIVSATPDTASAPSKSANKSEWVDHAVAQGMNREEAESLTKADLVERYGETA